MKTFIIAEADQDANELKFNIERAIAQLKSATGRSDGPLFISGHHVSVLLKDVGYKDNQIMVVKEK